MANLVFLNGRIGREPELRETNSGTSVLNVVLGTTYSYKTSTGTYEDKTDWHDVQIWGKMGESLSKRLQKGDLIHVSGRIEYNSYEDDKGSKQRRAKIKADSVDRLKWKD